MDWGITPPRALSSRPSWRTVARPEQIAPAGAWETWLLLAGRGFGKTRTGAEWVLEQARDNPGIRLALVAPTAGDARDVMVEGESGILACAQPGERPHYEPSKRRLTWPNGSQAATYSADEPDRLRGPQHHKAWADELAAWKRPEAWDMLAMGLRLGEQPQACVTTTPRPTRLIRALVARASTHVVRGSTFDNKANLPQAFLDAVLERYEGTRLGRQELYAEILDDVDGALWTMGMIDAARVQTLPSTQRIVVAVDPAVTAGEDSDETGILTAARGADRHAYVMADASGRYSPQEWAVKVCAAYDEYDADRVVIEVNQGGEMCEHTLRTVRRNLPITMVRASKGKRTRAEPVAALYEQGRVHHVGYLPALEDQLTSWVPGEPSPDRMDALVWALTDLMLGGSVSASEVAGIPIAPSINQHPWRDRQF